jgi:hypothetical protein
MGYSASKVDHIVHPSCPTKREPRPEPLPPDPLGTVESIVQGAPEPYRADLAKTAQEQHWSPQEAQVAVHGLQDPARRSRETGAPTAAGAATSARPTWWRTSWGRARDDEAWREITAEAQRVVRNAPDNVSAAALSVALTAGGAVKAYETTPLMTPEEGIERASDGQGDDHGAGRHGTTRDTRSTARPADGP